MKFTKSIVILSTAGVGLTLAYSQQSSSEVQQKALEILRQQSAGKGNAAPASVPAAPKASATQPTKDQLLADLERLHDEGKVSDEQYASYKKNITEQFAGPGAASQTQLLAQQALAQKIQQLKTAPPASPPPSIAQVQPAPLQKPTAQPSVQPAAVPPSNAEVQAKAQKALDEQLAQQRASQAAKTPPPAQPKAQAKAPKTTSPPPAAAAAAPAAATAPVAAAAAPAQTAPRTAERTNVIPATAYSTLSPQQEAQARELLRQKIAESNAQTVQTKPVAPAARSAAIAASAQAAPVQPAPQPAPARPAVAPAASVPPPSAPAAVPAAVTAQNTEAQAKALATLNEYQIGITSEIQPLLRILRLYIAELNGLITPAEAAKIPVATKFYGPSPWAFAATSPRTEIPFPTSNKEGLARLFELNALYLSNQISPGDYHQQRAKIVATL